jgi:acetyl esterase/lipase
MTRPSRALLLLGVCLLPLPLAAADAPAKPERIPLWDGPAPVGDGTTDPKNAFLTVHRPAAPNGTAVVICPGGGYGGLVVGAEGHGIAEWLGRHGITGLVLEYRLPAGRPFVPLLDAQRAIRTARSNAVTWKLDPNRIGILGFSAGGHLASTAAVRFDDGDANSPEPIAKMSCRPDFAILVYPVVTMQDHGHSGSRTNLLGKTFDPKLVEHFSNENQVTDRTPPVFLAHALDDKPVPPENSRRLFEALKKKDIPAKYVELPSGGHGLNGYRGPMWDRWQSESLEWLAERKLVPGK